MSVEHSAITDPNIHEPKGAAAASAGTYYRANGSGSGAWEYLHAYGEFYRQAGSDSLAMDSLNVFKSLDSQITWSHDSLLLENVTFDSRGYLTVSVAGDYLLSADVSFRGDSTVAVWAFAFAKTDSTISKVQTVEQLDSKVQNANLRVLATLDSSATVKLQVRNETDSAKPIFEDVLINLQLLKAD